MTSDESRYRMDVENICLAVEEHVWLERHALGKRYAHAAVFDSVEKLDALFESSVCKSDLPYVFIELTKFADLYFHSPEGRRSYLRAAIECVNEIRAKDLRLKSK